MRIFYNIQQHHLIVTPYRNGSSHLHRNMTQYNLYDITYGRMFKSMIDEAEKKTFIYRDPCLRLLSYYNQFVYTCSDKKLYKHDNEINRIFELFKPNVRGEDLLSDLLFAKDKIIKNYREDAHTRPQTGYFTDPQYQQSVNEYEIISINQYNKWLKLTFADNVDKPTSHTGINITVTNFNKMQKIQELCNILYKDDYELLEPNVTYL